MTARDFHPLDHAIWSSLTGAHAQFAEGSPEARRYRVDISPFMALPPRAGYGVDKEGWAALHRLAGPGHLVALFEPTSSLVSLPADWDLVLRGEALQLVATDALEVRPDPEAVLLGAADVEEMLDLVSRTQPGPFARNTYLLGGYLGVRRNGALVAMAGRRLSPPGWGEISAVCTDPAFRGQGLAARLVRAVAAGIRDGGETPFLHTAADNVSAIRLYEFLGFALRRRVGYFGVRTPAGAGE